MKDEILSIASDLREGSMTTEEAKKHLLILFGVVENCNHLWVWINSNDDNDLRRRCEKCGLNDIDL